MKRLPLDSADARHGSERGYAAGCREDCCRCAHTKYTRTKKAERIARGIPAEVHGTPNGYNNYDCRCDACQIAMLKDSGRRKREHREWLKEQGL